MKQGNAVACIVRQKASITGSIILIMKFHKIKAGSDANSIQKGELLRICLDTCLRA